MASRVIRFDGVVGRFAWLTWPVAAASQQIRYPVHQHGAHQRVVFQDPSVSFHVCGEESISSILSVSWDPLLAGF